jgi:mannose-6-phosphate isomerase-like protein (cupin superfamily)
MEWAKVDLQTVIAGLTRPFVMTRVVQIDHFALYVYLCEGAVSRHRHVTQDELFYVYSGLLSLDTDWGRLLLAPRELTVVPRGMEHSSGSIIHTVVLLFQAQSDPERKNGHGRLAIDKRPEALPKWSVAQEAEGLPQTYLPTSLAQVDEMSLRLVWCQGETSWHVHPEHDELLWVEDGRLDIGTEMGPLSLQENELVVIPRNRVHRLASVRQTIALSLIHGEVTERQHMGE